MDMRSGGKAGFIGRVLTQHHLLGQLVRFGLLTVASAGITVGVPVVLHEGFGVAPQTGAAIAFTIAFFVNFFSLRRLVFRSDRGARRDLATYVLSSLVFRGSEYLVFLLLLKTGLFYGLALVLVLGVSAVTKFFWYRRVLHRPAAGIAS